MPHVPIHRFPELSSVIVLTEMLEKSILSSTIRLKLNLLFFATNKLSPLSVPIQKRPVLSKNKQRTELPDRECMSSEDLYRSILLTCLFGLFSSKRILQTPPLPVAIHKFPAASSAISRILLSLIELKLSSSVINRSKASVFLLNLLSPLSVPIHKSPTLSSKTTFTLLLLIL